MREIDYTGKFRRDYKREKRTDPGVSDLVTKVVDLLVDDQPLPARLVDHALGGEWKGFRDCHIKPDLVLIYELTDRAVRLVRLGSHSELFG